MLGPVSISDDKWVTEMKPLVLDGCPLAAVIR